MAQSLALSNLRTDSGLPSAFEEFCCQIFRRAPEAAASGNVFKRIHGGLRRYWFGAEARELDEIDDQLEELHEQQQTLLAVLPTLAATSALGLAGKLAVAAVEVCPEENEEAHHLIASILRDLKAIAPPSP
jgi:hypothetical protein